MRLYFSALLKTRQPVNLIIMADKTLNKLFMVFLLTVAIFIPVGLAQTQALPQREHFHLTSWILDSSADSVTISFAYAIPYNKLIFTRARSVSDPLVNTFEADLTFSIDATDSVTGINHHRVSWSKIVTKDFSVTQAATRKAEDAITMMLPRSVYKISAEVRDDNQQISYMNTTETRRLNDSLSAFTLVFVDSMDNGKFSPIMMNGVAPFPKPISFALLTKDSTAHDLSLNLQTLTGSTIQSDSLPSQRTTLEPTDSDGTVSFRMVHSADHLLYLGEFKVDTLDEGEYQIEAKINGKADKIHFHYLWMDKPISLRNFKTALSLLKYLAPDSTFSYINSGSDKEEKEKFDQYWKSHDPTPKTAYNELEAEYYERADYAHEHFRTISADDGAATDRGKAYILFGKPASVRREFRSDGTYEIWSYPSQKKNLVFKEKGAGDFILYRTENL
jgi:GWxTD domain-containing protein